MDNKEIARLLGANGGKQTAKIHGTKHFSAAQKLSVEARKRNKEERLKKLSTGNRLQSKTE